MAALAHPTLRHPRTGAPLEAVGVVRGRLVWPILGAEDAPPAPPAAPAAPAPPSAPAATDTGFPAGTPVEQMTVEQQANYWKHYARQHETRAKQFGKLTPEELTALREKASKHDALELELGTTADKAAAKAADEAKAQALGELQPELISARLDAAAARAGVAEADLAKAIKFTDTSKFLKADGTVDADMVAEFVATIAPAKGNQQHQQRPGPSASGQGNRGPANGNAGDPARAWLAKQGIKVD